MRKVPALGLVTAAMIALAGCTGGGGTSDPSATTATATATQSAQAKVYSEDELRTLISGMTDADGNELKLYSKEQVNQGGNIANLLMSTATVDPKDCKDIATAGLLDTVENGTVAVAISGGDQPRTLSAQSGSQDPDAVNVLQQISGKMDQCAQFSVAALGQSYQVSSKELQANTDAQMTFATVSTRSGGNQGKLMQVSAAQGRLLVVATKGGTNLGDQDQKELEDLINKVLQKAHTGSGTSRPTSTSSASPEDSASPTATESENNETSSPSPTATR
ncbi:hypothetical protein [Pseudarthrobacter sp. NBSH8]|uniref:hypothetical protein n=1 Tax=Pseudarthrobacter sp. NBSH8 TaxID=2596911 RepID=UPI0021033D91|nr:hypothetical protein [Pseudarthrobacter sp. NBSH8]